MTLSNNPCVEISLRPITIGLNNNKTVDGNYELFDPNTMPITFCP